MAANQTDSYCFVPLDDKVSILEHCLTVLEDVENSLKKKLEDIHFVISELTDVDVKTNRLIMHVRLSMMALHKQVSSGCVTTKTRLIRSAAAGPGNAHDAHDAYDTLE